MKNGEMLQDTHGNPLHAHGGCMLEAGGLYYWFGEDRRGRVRVSCYRSWDLLHWEFRNHVLTLDSETQEHYVRTERLMEKAVMTRDHHQIFAGCNLERPKVVFCPKTGKYVMWMHYENGVDYSEAKCAVAVCDTVDGDYTYLGAFSPIGNMSRDCTLFVDDDGTGYFISAGRGNADTIIYRLSEDFLSIDEQVRVLWPGQYREAAALFKRRGRYYMLTSGCTGLGPQPGKKRLGRPTGWAVEPAHGLRGRDYLPFPERLCAVDGEGRLSLHRRPLGRQRPGLLWFRLCVPAPGLPGGREPVFRLERKF